MGIDKFDSRHYAFKAKIRLHALKFSLDAISSLPISLQLENVISIPGHIQQSRTESLIEDDDGTEMTTAQLQKLYENIKSSSNRADHEFFPRLQYQLYQGMQIEKINNEMVSIDQKREQLEIELNSIKDQMDDDESSTDKKEYMELKQSLEKLDKQYEEKRTDMEIVKIVFSIKLALFYYNIYSKLMEVWLSCRLLANGKTNVMTGTFQIMKLFRQTLHIYPVKIATNILKLNLRWYTLTSNTTTDQSSTIQVDNNMNIVAEMDHVSEFIARQSTLRFESTVLSSSSSEIVYEYADKIISQLVKELSGNFVPKEGQTLPAWLLNSIEI